MHRQSQSLHAPVPIEFHTIIFHDATLLYTGIMLATFSAYSKNYAGIIATQSSIPTLPYLTVLRNLNISLSAYRLVQIGHLPPSLLLDSKTISLGEFPRVMTWVNSIYCTPSRPPLLKHCMSSKGVFLVPLSTS